MLATHPLRAGRIGAAAALHVVQPQRQQPRRDPVRPLAHQPDQLRGRHARARAVGPGLRLRRHGRRLSGLLEPARHAHRVQAEQLGAHRHVHAPVALHPAQPARHHHGRGHVLLLPHRARPARLQLAAGVGARAGRAGVVDREPRQRAAALPAGQRAQRRVDVPVRRARGHRDGPVQVLRGQLHPHRGAAACAGQHRGRVGRGAQRAVGVEPRRLAQQGPRPVGPAQLAAGARLLVVLPLPGRRPYRPLRRQHGRGVGARLAGGAGRASQHAAAHGGQPIRADGGGAGRGGAQGQEPGVGVGDGGQHRGGDGGAQPVQLLLLAGHPDGGQRRRRPAGGRRVRLHGLLLAAQLPLPVDHQPAARRRRRLVVGGPAGGAQPAQPYHHGRLRRAHAGGGVHLHGQVQQGVGAVAELGPVEHDRRRQRLPGRGLVQRVPAGGGGVRDKRDAHHRHLPRDVLGMGGPGHAAAVPLRHQPRGAAHRVVVLRPVALRGPQAAARPDPGVRAGARRDGGGGARGVGHGRRRAAGGARAARGGGHRLGRGHGAAAGAGEQAGG
mmetsp:Transcript_37508/g.99827  ORF Transcript_37508/g.99827 Transcript_37508/m.99827 type:complete len:554 (+) Transcript_37508:3802-5463(+)